MKPIPANDVFEDLVFPIHGMDVSQEYERPPDHTTPSGINVRAFEPSTQRMRGGARPGISQYLPQIPGGASKVQHLNFIVDPTTDALISDDDPEGGSFIDDPSTNNLSTRNLGRRVRRGGSGRQPNRKKPKTITQYAFAIWNDGNDHYGEVNVTLNSTLIDHIAILDGPPSTIAYGFFGYGSDVTESLATIPGMSPSFKAGYAAPFLFSNSVPKSLWLIPTSTGTRGNTITIQKTLDDGSASPTLISVSVLEVTFATGSWILKTTRLSTLFSLFSIGDSRVLSFVIAK